MKTNIYKRPLFYFFVDLYLVSTYNARIIRVEISFDPTLRLEIFQNQPAPAHFGNALVEFNSFTDKEAIRMWDTITHHLRSELQKTKCQKVKSQINFSFKDTPPEIIQQSKIMKLRDRPDKHHFIFEANVGKGRIRHRTTKKTNVKK